MGLIVPFMSDLVAGLVGAAILFGLAVLLRKVGPKREQHWANKLRRLGWPALTFVFLVTALTSAILRGATARPTAVALGIVLALVLASVILLRFAPVKIRHQVSRLRAHIWQILTVLFFLSTVTLLLINTERPYPSEPIIFIVDLADEETMVLRDILDELEPELGYEVFLMSVDSSRYVARLDRMIASGCVKWDLIAVPNNMACSLAAKGLVEELSEYSEYEKLVPQTLLPSLRPLLKFEDRFYFAPFHPDVKIAFYNEQKFAQYGLRPPRTWDELLEVAKVFYEKEGVGRVAIHGYPGEPTAITVFEFVVAAGGDPLTLDDDGSKRAFAFLQELEPYLAPEYIETRFDTSNELLINDQVYLVSNWTFAAKVVVIDAGREEIKAYSGWKALGQEGREVHVLGGDVLAVPKGAPHPNEAIELIELLLREETQQELLYRLGWIPARLDAFRDIPPELTPYLNAASDALGFAILRPTTLQWPIVEGVFDRAFKKLVWESNDIALLEEYSATLKQVPAVYSLYPVRPGDTLEVIAGNHNTTVVMLAEANRITTWTCLSPGQILLIPEQGRDWAFKSL